MVMKYDVINTGIIENKVLLHVLKSEKLFFTAKERETKVLLSETVDEKPQTSNFCGKGRIMSKALAFSLNL